MTATNPVASYSLLNNATVSDVVTYKNQIDNNSVVAARIVNQFMPGPAATPNMTIVVGAGNIFNTSGLTEVAQQTSGTITAPAAGNNRIDRAVINSSGTLSIVTGTPTTGTPSPPAITSGCQPIAQIGTTANPLTNSTTAITSNMIADERNLSGIAVGTVPINALANIASGTVLANITGGSAPVVASTLTAVLDALMGSTQGYTLVRGASVWSAASNPVPTLHYYDFTSSGTFTTPSYITTSTVIFGKVTGSGGAGGSASNGAASGGGSAPTAFFAITGLSPSTGYTITIAASANGGASGGNNGSNGSTSTAALTVSITANGGNGGSAAVNGAGANTSSPGGTPGTTTANATITFPGSQGFVGAFQGNAGFTGAGAGSHYGPGGGSVITGNGNNGVNYGSGGAGGWNTGSTGGNSAPGFVEIWFVA